MTYNPSAYHRRSTRLKDYDYSEPGSYFVMVCVHGHKEIFGEILDSRMHLNESGISTKSVWTRLPKRFPHIELEEFVIMPNHMHGIINIMDSFAQSKQHFPSLGQIIRSYKAATSRHIRVSGTPEFQWQRNYYDHISRLHENELARIRNYIINNSAHWSEDSLYVSPTSHTIR